MFIFLSVSQSMQPFRLPCRSREVRWSTFCHTTMVTRSSFSTPCRKRALQTVCRCVAPNSSFYSRLPRYVFLTAPPIHQPVCPTTHCGWHRCVATHRRLRRGLIQIPSLLQRCALPGNFNWPLFVRCRRVSLNLKPQFFALLNSIFL